MMGFSPRGTGDRSAIHCNFFTDTGNLDLSGVAVGSLAMHFIDSRGHFRAGTGAWANLIKDNTTGLWSADYTPSAEDVALADTYDIYPVVPDLATGSPRSLDPQDFKVRDQP